MVKKLKYFLKFLVLIVMLTSCAANKPKIDCNAKVITPEIIDIAQDGYSITVPTNFKPYINNNCILTYSPENLKKDNNLEYVKFSSLGNIKKGYKRRSVKSLDTYVNGEIKRIKKEFSNPTIDVTKLEHDSYGEYRVLKFHSSLLNTNYSHAIAVFYVNNKVYRLSYSADNKNYNTYSNAFSRIIQSFKLKK